MYRELDGKAGKNGELAGTSGQSKRIEAIRVKLTGEIAKYYEVYYSVHLAKIGWCNYESAGRVTGTIDLSKKIEALKICLVKKMQKRLRIQVV